MFKKEFNTHHKNQKAMKREQKKREQILNGKRGKKGKVAYGNTQPGTRVSGGILIL